jgi:VanZ family protein
MMRNKNLVRYWLPLGVYCLVIFIQSSSPMPLLTLKHIDKLLHFVAYAMLGVLVFRAIRSLSVNISLVFIVAMAVFLSALIGLSDEIIQIFVPSRSVDRVDFFFDILGSLSGIMLYLLTRYTYFRMKRKG